MVLIKIHDDITGVIDIDEDFHWEELEGLYTLLSPREIGIIIAYQLFDVEYKLTEEILDTEINDYLSDLHQQIRDNCIDVLESNGIKVY